MRDFSKTTKFNKSFYGFRAAFCRCDWKRNRPAAYWRRRRNAFSCRPASSFPVKRRLNSEKFHFFWSFYSGFRQKFKKADPLHVKLLKKSGYLRERNEVHVENTDDDMTITFADFGHFIGSMIPKSSTFNAHFRPQFHACQGTVAIYIK